MKFEFIAYSFFVLLGFLVIGTVLWIDSPRYEHIWFATMWTSLLIPGVYFVTYTKSKWIKWSASCLIGWIFSAFLFEVIGIFNPYLVMFPGNSSRSFVWHLIAFLVALTLITITNGRKIHKRN